MSFVELARRLQFLEELLAENCGDSGVSLLRFSDKIEGGWEEYQNKFGNIHNQNNSNETIQEEHQFLISYDHGV